MTKNKLEVDNQTHLDQWATVNIMLLKAKRDYYSTRITNTAGDQGGLFRETAKFLNRNALQTFPSHSSLDDLTNNFADFYEDKILKIHDRLSKANQELGESSCSSTKKCSSSFSDFIPVSHDDIRNILMSSASKFCPLDAMPTTILNDCLDVILPVITKIVNRSLSTSVIPGKLKEALLVPSIKKAILDAKILKNFRPISNHAVTSKIVEKVVDSQLESNITAIQ